MSSDMQPTPAESSVEPAQMEPVWPMPVKDFLSGAYLKRADVVLTRKNNDLKSWLIRWATRGSFSHAAMVFLVPHQEKGFDNSFVIESASKGVDLANLEHYLTDKGSVVGIKRLDNTWFDEGIQSRVRGRMLNSIESEYSYSTAANIVFDFLNRLAFGMRSRIYGARKAIKTQKEKSLKPPNEFICSGLVQLGFVQTVVEMVNAGAVVPERIADVVFHPELQRFLPEDWQQFTFAEQLEIAWSFYSGFQDVLESVTPEHLASSDLLAWKYVVNGGLVHQVHSTEDAHSLLAWKPA